MPPHFRLQTGTCLHETDDNWKFAVASNRDVFAIKTRNTGTNSTEVHVLSASSKYKKFKLQTGTCLHEINESESIKWDWAFGLSPNRDLFAIKKSGTMGSTEVHILSASSKYKKFKLQVRTPLRKTSMQNYWNYVVASNRDVFAIKRKHTGTNSTEVHVLSASNKYQKFGLQTGTCLHNTMINYSAQDNWAFALGTNNDLFAIKKRNTGTNSTEVHVLSASSKYKKFKLQTGTCLHETDKNWAFALGTNNDLFAIKKRNTGTNSTEVHIIDLT